MSTTYNLINQSRIDRGATFSATFTWKDSNGAAYNISGYSCNFEIFVEKNSALLYSATTLNGALSIDGANGKISILIPASSTSNLSLGIFYYSLTLTEIATGIVTRLLEGKVEIG